MGYDTQVDLNAWWLGDTRLVVGIDEAPLVEQVAENIRELLHETERDRVTADHGAEEFRVVVSVKLVPFTQCEHCGGTGTIGVVVRLGATGDEDVPCPKCNGEGRV